MNLKRMAVGLGALLSLFLATAAPAAPLGSATQQISQKVGVCDPLFAGNCVKPTAGGAIPVSGTITTTLGAFNPKGTTTLAVTSTSARVAFPTADTSVLIRNTGTTDAFLAFGSSSVVATTGGVLLPAGQAVNFDTGGTADVAAITASGSTSLSVTTGTGLSALTGGGGGSGGGGAVTINASGVAAGAYVSGSYLAGALADGANVTLGTKADAANCATGNTQIACVRQLHTDLTSAIPAGSNSIGTVGLNAGSNTIGAAYAYQNSAGNVIAPTADTSAAISTASAATTQLVALSSGKKIYVTSFDFLAGGTSNVTLVYGTGTNCGTGTTSLTGAYPLTAQAGIAKGNGQGVVLVVPASNALCVTNSAAVQVSGSVSFAQY